MKCLLSRKAGSASWALQAVRGMLCGMGPLSRSAAAPYPVRTVTSSQKTRSTFGYEPRPRTDEALLARIREIALTRVLVRLLAHLHAASTRRLGG